MSLFNISDFRAKLNKRQGISKTNLFVVDIHAIGDETFADGDLRFFCHSANIPGMSLMVNEYRPRGIGLPDMIPTGFNLEIGSFIFFVDSKLDVMKFFHNWHQRIINTNDRSLSAEVDGALPYELGYKDEYSGTIVIRMYTSGTTANFIEFTMREAFPINIGSVELAWGDTDQFAQIPIAFAASSFETTSQISGREANESNRAHGVLDFMKSIGSIGQSVSQRPTGTLGSIQSWIDQYTRVKNSWDALMTFLN